MAEPADTTVVPSHRRPRVLAVAHQKGGTGKTTIVCNLAAVIADLDPTLQTVIIDLDSQGSATLQMTGQSHADVGSYDYVIAGKMPKGFIRRTHLEPCLIIPATRRLTLSDMDMVAKGLSYPELGRRLRDNMRSVDLIILDCPAGFGAISTMAMAIADVVLMPTQPAFFAVKSLRQTLRHMEQLRRNAHEKCAVILSMYEPDSRVHQTIADHIHSEFADMVIPTRIPIDPAAEEAAAANTLVVETSPKAPSSQAFRTMAVHILRRVGIEPKFLAAPGQTLPDVSPPPEPRPSKPETTEAEAPPPQPIPTPLPPIPPPPSMTQQKLELPAMPGEAVQGTPNQATPRTESVIEAIPDGLHPKPDMDRLTDTTPVSAAPKQQSKRRTWKHLLVGLCTAIGIAAAVLLGLTADDTEELMIAISVAVVVVIPFLGYLFYVLKRA